MTSALRNTAHDQVSRAMLQVMREGRLYCPVLFLANRRRSLFSRLVSR
jgi:hypothetical protein